MDWYVFITPKNSNQNLKGNMKIIANDDQLVIEFLNTDWSLYAKCPVPEDYSQAVIKCIDSSRGYAIRLASNDGRYMWVGLGFHDRNEAFDFQVCFHDFKSRREMDRNPEQLAQDNKPTKDFALKEGEKINVTIQSKGVRGGQNQGPGQMPGNNFGGAKFGGGTGGFE